jgi:hypothetical protein
MTRGGFPCPVTWCEHRSYTASMLRQHIAEDHPEETPVGPLSLSERIRYAIRNLICPAICTIRGHRMERVEVGWVTATICTRCGEN